MSEQSRFNDLGFLSEECFTNDISKQVTDTEYFKVCKSLNELAQSLLNKAVVHPDDRKEVYATLYFQRMLSHYQAILIMAERCMLHQVEVMLRCMLETLFDLVAFHKNKELFEALVMGDSAQRLEMLKLIRQQQETKATYTHEELNDLDKAIASAEDIDRDDFKIYMKADLAGMLHEYRTTYASLSQAVHSTINSLEVDLIYSDIDDGILGMNAYGQKTGELSTLLMTSANYLLVGIDMQLSIFPNTDKRSDALQLNDKVQLEWQKAVVSAVPH